MPIGVLGIIALASAGGTAAAGIYGANKQAGAATNAAKLQTDAANHAADIQAAAANRSADVQKQMADETLAFQKQQAEASFQASQVASKGNYDQWAAAQHRLSSVGEMIGMGPREIPGFVSQPDPFSSQATAPNSAQTMPGGTSQQMPQSGASAQQIIQGYQQQNPYSANSINDILGLLNKAGIPATRATHGVNGSLQSDDKIVLPGGQVVDLVGDVGGANNWMYSPDGMVGATSTPAAKPLTVGTVASYLTPQSPQAAQTPFMNSVPIAPALSMPNPYAVQNPYAAVRPVGSYL